MFSKVRSSRISPRGQGRDATFFISDAMPAMRSSLRSRRSCFGSAESILSKSLLFAVRIVLVLATR